MSTPSSTASSDHKSSSLPPSGASIIDPSIHIESLVQIVDAALSDATVRSGPWLACRPGCSQCCHGVFAISAIDAHRLREGLSTLVSTDSARAQRVQQRANDAVARLAPTFPGDPHTGHLATTPEADLAFEDFANDEPCPALDPATQTCDLYAARPIVCRTFGPPLKTAEDSLAVCELCFDGASTEEMERCQLDPNILTLESQANSDHEQATGEIHTTIIAFALAHA